MPPFFVFFFLEYLLVFYNLLHFDELGDWSHRSSGSSSNAILLQAELIFTSKRCNVSRDHKSQPLACTYAYDGK